MDFIAYDRPVSVFALEFGESTINFIGCDVLNNDADSETGQVTETNHIRYIHCDDQSPEECLTGVSDATSQNYGEATVPAVCTTSSGFGFAGHYKVECLNRKPFYDPFQAVE